MYYQSYLHNAVALINGFNGSVPLQHYLKKHFAENKKFGSKDRKQITGLCYAYFRTGHALKSFSVEEKILAGIFLTHQSANDYLSHFKSGWNEKIQLTSQEKFSMLNSQSSITDIFPWKDELSEGIDYEKFCESFLIQPDLFLRIRPGNELVVKDKLAKNNIPFIAVSESCMGLNNSTKIDELVDIDKEAVVQDYSSQKISDFFSFAIDHSPFTAWDCCAGSGGKSIMLFDKKRDVKLTVSDIRESILHNLKKRFQTAGIKKYKAFVTDLAASNHQLQVSDSDLLIADVPCTGSGTWSRTPDALYFFGEKEIERFSQLQKKIVANIIPCLKKGGRLLYITCSVFRKENEEVAAFIQSSFNLQLERMELLKGYDKKADTMFAAVFIV